MSREKTPSTPEMHGPPQLGEPGEHPLSILLFSWMRSQQFFRVFMAIMLAAGVALIAFEVTRFLDAPQTYFRLDNLPGFYGVFGFLAFSFAVLSGWLLGRLLRRPEDYYDTSSGEAGRDR